MTAARAHAANDAMRLPPGAGNQHATVFPSVDGRKHRCGSVLCQARLLLRPAGTRTRGCSRAREIVGAARDDRRKRGKAPLSAVQVQRSLSADLVRGTLPVALTGTLVFAVRVLASRGGPRPRLASVRVGVAPHGPTFADQGPTPRVPGGHHGGTGDSRNDRAVLERRFRTERPHSTLSTDTRRVDRAPLLTRCIPPAPFTLRG